MFLTVTSEATGRVKMAQKVNDEKRRPEGVLRNPHFSQMEDMSLQQDLQGCQVRQRKGRTVLGTQQGRTAPQEPAVAGWLPTVVWKAPCSCGPAAVLRSRPCLCSSGRPGQPAQATSALAPDQQSCSGAVRWPGRDFLRSEPPTQPRVKHSNNLSLPDLETNAPQLTPPSSWQEETGWYPPGDRLSTGS